MHLYIYCDLVFFAIDDYEQSKWFKLIVPYGEYGSWSLNIYHDLVMLWTAVM